MVFRSKQVLGAISIMLSLATSVAHAEDRTKRLQEDIYRLTGGSVAPDTVRPTPVDGLYEVTIGTELMYVDRTGQYAMVEGHLVDLASKTDLTAQRLAELTKISFADLPLSKAIKFVSGTGKRQVAVFEDPDCGYCQKVHRFLENQEDVTVYVFPYPADRSRSKAEIAWCSSDRAGAWSSMMRTGQVTGSSGSCLTPIDDVLTWGRERGILATPTLIFADGTRIEGAPDPQLLVQKLDGR